MDRKKYFSFQFSFLFWPHQGFFVMKSLWECCFSEWLLHFKNPFCRWRLQSCFLQRFVTFDHFSSVCLSWSDKHYCLCWHWSKKETAKKPHERNAVGFLSVTEAAVCCFASLTRGSDRRHSLDFDHFRYRFPCSSAEREVPPSHDRITGSSSLDPPGCSCNVFL